jgi:hypothetical protein
LISVKNLPRELKVVALLIDAEAAVAHYIYAVLDV